MDIYCTIEEKYLQALDERSFGETPKALQLFNEIVSNEPGYARAHYQLGMICYYDIQDYQTAGYHFRLCADLEPAFPDVYFHYMQLLVFLNMDKQIQSLQGVALNIAGVEKSSIYNLLGLHAEKNKRWTEAILNYRSASIECTDKSDKENIDQAIKRVKAKIQTGIKVSYQIAG